MAHNRIRTALAITAAALTGLAGTGPGQASAEDAEYRISITGDEGAQVLGACVLEKQGGAETVDVQGSVPLQQTLTGIGLTCTVSSTGNIVVEASKGDAKTRSATNGGEVTITLR